MSVAGLLIPITSLADPGQDLDAADTSEPQGDEGFSTNPPMYERWVEAANNDTVAHDLSIQWGGSGADYRVTVSLPAKTGPVRILGGEQRGWLLQRGVAVKAWADSANKINVKVRKVPYRGD